jgi:drug/metabolite transporter (DMT)-like permease
VVAIATTLILWCAAFVAIRVATAQFSIAGMTLGRLGIASLALAGRAWAPGVRLPAYGDLPRRLSCSLTGMIGYQLLLNAGERTVDAGTANLRVNTSPVLTVGLACAMLGSRPSLRVWVGIGLVFSGAPLLAVLHGDGFRLSPQAQLVLAAALCQATFFVTETPLLRRSTALEVTCYATWISALCMLPGSGQLAADLGPASATALGSVLFLGIGSSAVAYVTWAYALRHVDVATASNTLYLAPLLTIAIGWLLLDESPPWATLLGGAIVQVGVAVARPRRRSSDVEPATTTSPAD